MPMKKGVCDNCSPLEAKGMKPHSSSICGLYGMCAPFINVLVFIFGFVIKLMPCVDLCYDGNIVSCPSQTNVFFQKQKIKLAECDSPAHFSLICVMTYTEVLYNFPLS